MAKRAIAYTSDIILGTTGEVIGRQYQKELIRQFAEENGIEIVAWFEDEIYDEDILTRPGIQKMLACEEPCDLFLVERVWALSRKMEVLDRFFNVIDRKKAKLESASCMWDCTSQMVRRRFDPSLPAVKVPKPVVVVGEEHKKVAIRRPERFHFVGWAFKPQPA